MKTIVMRRVERHRTPSVDWLRAAVLGADDVMVSTAGLISCVTFWGPFVMALAAAVRTMFGTMHRNQK